MDLEVLKKKISTFRGDAGRVRITDDHLLIEILSEWEKWTGPADGFYKAIGVSAKGMGSIIGRAKKLRREGFPAQDFKEIKIAEPLGPYIIEPPDMFKLMRSAYIEFTNTGGVCGFRSVKEEGQHVS